VGILNYLLGQWRKGKEEIDWRAVSLVLKINVTGCFELRKSLKIIKSKS
jgi:hypothetical protein